MITDTIDFDEIKNNPILKQRYIALMSEDPSLLLRFANYWSELTLWQKFLGGICVSGLPTALSIVANSGFLLTIGGINAVTYISASVSLDELSQWNKQRLDYYISSAKNMTFFATPQQDMAAEVKNLYNLTSPETTIGYV